MLEFYRRFVLCCCFGVTVPQPVLLVSSLRFPPPTSLSRDRRLVEVGRSETIKDDLGTTVLVYSTIYDFSIVSPSRFIVVYFPPP